MFQSLFMLCMDHYIFLGGGGWANVPKLHAQHKQRKVFSVYAVHEVFG